MDEREILEAYERRPRVITPEFIASIPWDDIKNHPLDPAFLPTLLYMRDVERLTEVYFAEMRRTDTWKNPHIRRFMERWSTEEPVHGDLLNRFLGEAGYPSDDGWYEKVKQAMPLQYRLRTAMINPLVAKLVGRSFQTLHMVWGAINEYTAMSSYSRISTLAGHPVLSKLLHGIMAEEASHANFYGSVARAQLERSAKAQGISRFFIEKYWTPVGQGAKLKKDTDHVSRLLYKGAEGVRFFDQRVSSVIRKFPGFDDITKLTDTIASASENDLAQGTA